MTLARRRIESKDTDLTTQDGARASLEERDGREALTIRDRAGRLLFEYDAVSGRGTLLMPEGDLRLSAPKGMVEIVGGEGVRILSGGALEVNATTTKLDLGDASASAKSLHAVVDRAELTFVEVVRKAERVIDHADTMYQRVSDLLETKAGRLRTLVRDGLWMKADEVTVVAKKDIHIDGEHINLG